ncbi:poly(3-hydroxyalkanoate) polymerase [Chloroflexota bacterium]|nr:poly(3-hydroxyalkanoate) polymerase [Chloroflexota bacterium]
MTKKEKDKGPDKINFEDLSSVFENNLKIYNQYVESFKNLGSSQNNFPTFPFNNQNSNNFTMSDLSNLIAPTMNKMMESFKNFSTEIQQNPNVYFDSLNKWVSQIANLNFYFVTRASGGMANPVIFEEKSDRRFSNEEWKTNLFFDFIKQFYLISANFMNNLIENIEFKNPKDKRIMQFYLKQLNSALSPSNFAFTNPEVLKKTVDEKGNNLAKGYENYKKDFEKHPNKLFIQQSKAGEFEIGKNLATTKGKVIFKSAAKSMPALPAQMQAALEQAEALCRRASSAVAEDVVAFEAVIAALRQPAANASESAARSAALSAATLRAAEVQLDVARAATGIVQLAQICATHGNINAAPDAAAAAHLALGGLCAAVLNVRSNCASLPDEEQASALAAAATRLETNAHAALQATLQAVASRTSPV